MPDDSTVFRSAPQPSRTLLTAKRQAGINLRQQPCLTVFLHPLHDCFKELAVSHALHNWIFIGANAYIEYTFITWLNRNVYRRTVDYRHICLQ